MWKVEERKMLARRWRVERPMPPVAPIKTHVRLVGGEVAACVLWEKTVESETMIVRRAWGGRCVDVVVVVEIAAWTK